MLMDVGTDFGGDYAPSDADNLERGPVRVRNALQFSLNIPSVKAMGINGPTTSSRKAQDFGMNFQGESRTPVSRSRSASRRSARSTWSRPTARSPTAARRSPTRRS